MRITADWLHGPGAQVCALLQGVGHQAWYVGGCVRNAVIGGAVTDVDITTDARPEIVTELAQNAGLRVIPTGIDHGTVTVLVAGTPFEVTTFRRDVATDGRHATVAFATTIAEDAARRDFTMNALYAGSDGAVADPIGGLADTLAHRVRFIGDAGARIGEDYLRILRFFRFYAWYGAPDGGIDADGLAACADNLDGLERLSRERITGEMRKLLSAPDPAPALAAMAASGVLLRLMPGSAWQVIAVLVHVEQAANLPPDPIRRLAALTGGAATDVLRLSNAETARLVRLTNAMHQEIGPGELGYRLGATDALDVLVLRAAMMTREIDPDMARQAQFGAAQTCPVRAADLMPAMQGPALGAALRQIETRWIASGFTLTRDELLS